MPFRIDETDPQVMIVHTGDHIGPEDYEDFLKYWASRFEGEERFGIVLVNEPHTHDEEGDEELSEEELQKIREERGARLIRIINDFRRDYRQRSNQKTIGMANVYPADAEWIQDLGEDGWEDMQTKAMMRSNYMFGIRGRNFTGIEKAKAWIKEQASQPPISLADDPQAPTAGGGRVGLFYGSTTGVTEEIADQIANVWSETGLDALEAVNISYLDDISNLKEFDYLILGCPTWNVGELQDDWELELPNLEDVDFSGKRVALFGVGDQAHYSDNFQDALGILGRKLRERGATLVGFTPTEGYDYDESVGVENDMFMGLAIDEVNQSDLTSERIEAWVKQLVREFELTPA